MMYKSTVVHVRLEQQEPELPETGRHRGRDYRLPGLSAGPLQQPIRAGKEPVKMGQGQGSRGTLLTDKRD